MSEIHRFTIATSPIGPLTLDATASALLSVRFGPPAPPTPAELPSDGHHPVLGPVRDAFERYFEGESDAFPGIPLDLTALTPFQRAVLEALRRVPQGEVTTYGELARAAGRGSPRAVGQAVGANPIPVVIPCHRVVARGGRLGGFSGGLERKVVLLALEGIRVDAPHARARLRDASELSLPL